jgi:sialidase-1
MRTGVHPRFARSFDGGESWTAPVAQPQLLQPAAGVMTSILRIPRRGRGRGHSTLVYSTPNSTNFRAAGRIHVSCDEGAAWTPGKLLFPGKFGYSVMTVLDDGSLGVFFERSRIEGFSVDVEHLSFVRLTRDWLASEQARCAPRRRRHCRHH